MLKRLAAHRTHPVVVACALTLIAWVLRRGLIHFPVGAHPDEPIVSHLVLRALSSGTWTMNWDGFPDTFWSRPSYQFSPFGWLLLGLTGLVQAFRAKPLGEDQIILLARATSSVFSALAVGVTALAAHRLFRSRLAAYLSALILAFAFLSVQDGIYARVDALVSFAAALCLYCAARAREEPGRRWLIAGAAVAGLAVALKYNTAALALLPLLAWRWPEAGGAPRSWSELPSLLLLLALGGLGGFVLGTPELLRDPAPLFQGLRFELSHYLAAGHPPHQAGSGWDGNLAYWTRYLTLLGFGVLPTLLAAGYLGLAARRRGGADRLLAVYLLVAGVIAFAPKVRFERNLENLLPALALAAGAMAAWLLERLGQRAGTGRERWAPATIALASLLLLAQPTRTLLHFREALRPGAAPDASARTPVREPSSSTLAFFSPTDTERGLRELVLLDYGDPWSRDGLVRWRRWIGEHTEEIQTSAWSRHGYPYSTVDAYHGPARLVILWPATPVP